MGGERWGREGVGVGGEGRVRERGWEEKTSPYAEIDMRNMRHIIRNSRKLQF